jgi:putative (di)nucleoside polyphosphate hydrolase
MSLSTSRHSFSIAPTAPDSAYRLGVGVMILNQKNKIFIAKRADLAHSVDQALVWQMPQGGVDYGEDPYLAALREMKEEIGTNDVTLLAETKDWAYYDLPEELAGKLWNGRFVGQKQKWYLFRYDGYDKDINIHTPHPEFCEWKWASPSEVLDLIVAFKRDLYYYLVHEFRDYLGDRTL